MPRGSGSIEDNGTRQKKKNIAYAATWKNQKQTPMIITTITDDTRWWTEAVYMSVDKQAIIKLTGRANNTLECWG